MSIAAAISSTFSTSGRPSFFSFERQRARYASERLDSEEPAAATTAAATIEDVESGAAAAVSPRSAAVDDGVVDNNNSDDEGDDTNNNNRSEGTEPSISVSSQALRSRGGGGDGSEENSNSDSSPTGSDGNNDDQTTPDTEPGGITTTTTTTRPSIATMTLAELEEERELARRRSSACVLLGVFILFRLWIQALQTGDFGLLLLCLVGTSWTARWVRHNREREEELDRRIAAYLENSQQGSASEVDRNDLRMLSFQTQLALAIMESQRQMMQGGHGHPDGQHQSKGVSETSKAKWERYCFKEDCCKSGNDNKRGSYGSLPQNAAAAAAAAATTKHGLDEEPHCSICLGEYEDGDQLVKLPCSHIYHEDCISSWTANHTKCPLCNDELEVATSSDDEEENLDNSNTPSVDSIV